MSASDDVDMYDPEPPVLTVLRFIRVVAETEKALLLQTTLDHGVWLPKAVAFKLRRHLGTVSVPYAMYKQLCDPLSAVTIEKDK